MESARSSHGSLPGPILAGLGMRLICHGVLTRRVLIDKAAASQNLDGSDGDVNVDDDDDDDDDDEGDDDDDLGGESSALVTRLTSSVSIAPHMFDAT